MTKNIDTKNTKKLPESQIFENIKKQLDPIQENLIEKKITINDAKDELQKINEWIQWTKLEKEDKEEVWKVFENLIKSENDIDENSLKNEFNEIIKLLEKSSQRDLANLKQRIKQNNQQWNFGRSIEIQQWIEESSKNLSSTINDASQDKNPIARKIGKWMQKLIS